MLFFYCNNKPRGDGDGTQKEKKSCMEGCWRFYTNLCNMIFTSTGKKSNSTLKEKLEAGLHGLGHQWCEKHVDYYSE